MSKTFPLKIIGYKIYQAHHYESLGKQNHNKIGPHILGYITMKATTITQVGESVKKLSLCTLLMGMKIDTAIINNRTKDPPHKIKNRITI